MGECRMKRVLTQILLPVLVMTLGLCAVAAAFELPDGTVTAYDLNVRRQADVKSEAFYKLRKGQTVKVKAINGEWYKVRLSNGKEGYVHNKYLSVRVWARVVQATGKIYKQPMGNAPVLGDMRGLGWVSIVNKSDSWYQIELNARTRGWVQGMNLEVPEQFFMAWMIFQHGAPQSAINAARAQAASRTVQRGFVDTTPPPPTRNDRVPAGSVRYQMVEFAKKYIGTPYVWGGESLGEGGFDCSGFVYFVYQNFGMKLMRVSHEQATQGRFVPNGQMMPGDLVFFDTSGGNNGNVGHAGMYIGGGNFIHASSSYEHGRYVRISSLDDGYYRDAFVTARRFFN